MCFVVGSVMVDLLTVDGILKFFGFLIFNWQRILAFLFRVVFILFWCWPWQQLITFFGQKRSGKRRMLASRGAPSERAEKELRWHDKRHTGRNGQWIHGLWWEWGLAELFAQQIVLFRSHFCFNFYLIFYMNSKSWVFSYLFVVVVFLVVR